MTCTVRILEVLKKKNVQPKLKGTVNSCLVRWSTLMKRYGISHVPADRMNRDRRCLTSSRNIFFVLIRRDDLQRIEHNGTRTDDSFFSLFSSSTFEFLLQLFWSHVFWSFFVIVRSRVIFSISSGYYLSHLHFYRS